MLFRVFRRNNHSVYQTLLRHLDSCFQGREGLVSLKFDIRDVALWIGFSVYDFSFCHDWLMPQRKVVDERVGVCYPDGQISPVELLAIFDSAKYQEMASSPALKNFPRSLT